MAENASARSTRCRHHTTVARCVAGVAALSGGTTTGLGRDINLITKNGDFDGDGTSNYLEICGHACRRATSASS